ncbi:MAG: ABC transporter permease [Clostridium sp.]|jgi:ABC-2 type transporter|nr:ABC transporter permease [Clostridium sp.]
MFIKLLKKEIKQFLRSKSNLIMLFLFPVILITTLSFGLKSLMENTSDKIFEGDENNIVYYSLKEESIYKDGFLNFIDALKDEINVNFKETNSLEKVKKEIDNYEAYGFIEVNKEGFKYYSPKNGEKIRGKILRSIFETSLNEFSVYNTIGKFNPENLKNIIKSSKDKYIKEDSTGKLRNITSSEYYTFAELALIILYVSTTVGESIIKEKELKTINRIRLSKAKESNILFSKLSLGFLVAVIQILIVYIYSSLVLKVDWGENTLKFLAIFIVFGIFVSSLGLIFGMLCKKESSLSGILNAIIIVMCILGGCYTPISIIIQIPILNKLMVISPVYWINTAISSMLCSIKTNAYYISLIIPLTLSIIMLVISLLLGKRRSFND